MTQKRAPRENVQDIYERNIEIALTTLWRSLNEIAHAAKANEAEELMKGPHIDNCDRYELQVADQVFMFMIRECPDILKPENRDDLCRHCGGRKEIANPTGHCSHLYWPDGLTDEAKRANGYREELTKVWVKREPAQ